MQKKTPRILMVRLSAIGDVVNTLPSLTALRRCLPSAYIAWLVEDKAASVLEGHPLLDEVFVFERKRLARSLKTPSGWSQAVSQILGLQRRLRRARFDLLLDFHGNLKSGLLGCLADAAVRVGFDRKNSREGNFLFNDHHVSLPWQRIHRVEKHLALLRALGVRTTEASVALNVPPSGREFASAYLRCIGHGSGPLVILHPGASAFGAHKRWPLEHYAELADRLVRQASARVVVTHGPGELDLVCSIARQCASEVTLPETPSLQHLIGLIEKASVFVSADTGPMHLAAALKVPVVALFGPKDPVIYGPYGTASRILMAEVDCRPCGGRTCDDPVCMRSISPGRVFDAVLDLLASERRASSEPGDPR